VSWRGTTYEEKRGLNSVLEKSRRMGRGKDDYNPGRKKAKKLP